MPEGQSTVLHAQGICKSFLGSVALDTVDFALRRGEVHALLGENGAGKSTLIKCLTGAYRRDDGAITLDGMPIDPRDTFEAQKIGIGTVYQEVNLLPNLSVAENLYIGRQPMRFGMTRNREMQRLATALLSQYGLDIDPAMPLASYSVAVQQIVAIARAVDLSGKVLILDEPTGVLTPAEADHLFRILKQLKDQGKTVIFITHKLREIMAITDEVSVMRRGEIVATRQTAATSVEELAELMVGRRVLLRVEKGEARPTDVKLSVRNLTVRDNRGVTMVDNVSFDVRAGEIVGIAGVAGNGQSELLEAISGMRRAVSGTIDLNGHTTDVTAHRDPGGLRKRGLAHVPEDRHHMGLVLKFEESENAILGYHDDPKYGRMGLLDVDAIRADAQKKIEQYDIRPPNARLKTANFSGGNQQKIVLAREMERNPDVLIIGQPTRGVDVGAIEFIHRRIIEMRDAGKAILLVSVELDEIRSLSDRILVMFSGRVVGERSPDTPEGEIGLLMAGVEKNLEAAQ